MFPRLAATRKEARQTIKALAKNHGGVSFLITDKQASAIPSEAQTAMMSLGITPVVIDPDGLPFVSIATSARQLHIQRQHRKGFLQESTEAVSSLIHSLIATASSPLHNLHVTNFYLNEYQKMNNGELPKEILEIGFGKDPAGQLLACALRGIQFNGVSADKGPHVKLKTINYILGLLNVEANVEKARGAIIYEKLFQETDIKRCFALIYAHVVLEHVADPLSFFQTVNNRLQNNGVFISIVDLTGHVWGANPYDFLYPSQEEWMIKPIAQSLPTRYRRDDYVRIMREAGFTDIDIEVRSRMEPPEDLKQKYPEQDISPAMICLTCRKT